MNDGNKSGKLDRDDISLVWAMLISELMHLLNWMVRYRSWIYTKDSILSMVLAALLTGNIF